MPWCGLSPAELCMGRQIRTTVPQQIKHLLSQWAYLPKFKRGNVEFKEEQKIHFDIWHNTKESPEMPHPVNVWVNSGPEPV